MTKSVSKLSTLGLYLSILSVSPVIFMTNILDAFNTPKVWLLASSVSALLAHAILTPKESIFSKRKVLLTIFPLVLLSGMFITSFFSDTATARILWGYPGRANGMIYYTSIFLAISAVIWTSSESQIREKSQLAIHIPLLVNVIYCTIQFLNLDPIAWSNSYNRIIGVFGNPNFSAAALAVHTILLLYLSIDNHNLLRLVYFAGAIWSSFLSWKTESIQGPLLIGFGISLMLLSAIRQRYSFRTFLFSISVFASMFAMAVVSLFGYGPLGGSLQQYTLLLRLEYWKIAIQSALNNPIIGLGPDSYFEGFLQHRTPEFIAKYSLGLRADAAHSAPLNFLANFGFLNFALYSTLLITITSIALRILFGVRRREFLRVFAFAWVLLTFQSFFSLEQVGLGILQWLTGGVLLSSNLALKHGDELVKRKREGRNTKVDSAARNYSVRDFRGELAFAALILALFAFSLPIKDELALKRIISLSTDNDENRKYVIEEMKRISETTKSEYKRALYLSDYFLRANDVENAVKVIEHIIVVDRQSVDALEQLAKIRHFKNQYLEEVVLRQKIFELNPNDFRNTLQLAEAFVILGEQESARKWASITKEISVLSPESDSATAIIDSLKE